MTAFAEVGMETQVSGISVSTANPSIFHWDFPLPHVATDSELFIRETMSEPARDVVTTSSAVVKGKEFHPASEGLFGHARTKLTYEHGLHYRRNYVVELEEGYEFPQVTVTP